MIKHRGTSDFLSRDSSSSPLPINPTRSKVQISNPLQTTNLNERQGHALSGEGVQLHFERVEDGAVRLAVAGDSRLGSETELILFHSMISCPLGLPYVNTEQWPYTRNGFKKVTGLLTHSDKPNTPDVGPNGHSSLVLGRRERRVEGEEDNGRRLLAGGNLNST